MQFILLINLVSKFSKPVISVAFIFLGSMLKNDLVWELTDFFNYLMVIPNVIALFALGKAVGDEAKRARQEKNKK